MVFLIVNEIIVGNDGSYTHQLNSNCIIFNSVIPNYVITVPDVHTITYAILNDIIFN